MTSQESSSNFVDYPEPPSPLAPKAAPPAAAPPPPPPASSSAAAAAIPTYQMSDEHDPLLPPSSSSYQRGGRALEPPTIHTEEYSRDGQSRWLWKGNPLLTPNVGLTNSYETSCAAIHEFIQQLRLGLIMITSATLFILFWTWWRRLILFQWSLMVVSFYLGFLAMIVLVTEVTTLFRLDHPIVRRIHDQFGFLSHPVGKPFLLLLMSTLCITIGGLWEFLLSILYFFCVLALIVLGQEAEFRRNYYQSFDGGAGGGDRTDLQPYATTAWSYFSSLAPSRRHPMDEEENGTDHGTRRVGDGGREGGSGTGNTDSLLLPRTGGRTKNGDWR